MWESVGPWIEALPRLRHFPLLEDAKEWAEDQVIFRYGGFDRYGLATSLGEQALLAGLPAAEIVELAALGEERRFKIGERIVCAGDPARSVFFLQSGLVSIKLPSGARLATLSPGMAFGEMADEFFLASLRAYPRKLMATGYDFQYPQLEEALRHGLNL